MAAVTALVVGAIGRSSQGDGRFLPAAGECCAAVAAAAAAVLASLQVSGAAAAAAAVVVAAVCGSSSAAGACGTERFLGVAALVGALVLCLFLVVADALGA